jgi:hypothetical protein
VELEEALDGGTMSGATRAGATVRRTAGPWTPTIHRLLSHIRRHGITWVPQPMGIDERGRETLSFLPGVVPQYPLPSWIWDDRVLISSAQRLATLHDVTATFDLVDGVWQLPAHRPVEVVCHNDFAPYNLVFVGGQLSGVIDWDTASPGPRVWDLAYLAYRLVPLVDAQNPDVEANSGLESARRLRLLCDSYGHDQEPAAVIRVAVERLRELADFTAQRAASGDERLRSHVAIYLRDADWIAAHASALTS